MQPFDVEAALAGAPMQWDNGSEILQAVRFPNGFWAVQTKGSGLIEIRSEHFMRNYARMLPKKHTFWLNVWEPENGVETPFSFMYRNRENALKDEKYCNKLPVLKAHPIEIEF